MRRINLAANFNACATLDVVVGKAGLQKLLVGQKIIIVIVYYGRGVKDCQDGEDEDNLELKGIDRPPIVRELHEECVILLKTLRVRQRGRRLQNGVFLFAKVFDTFTMADLMIAGVLSTDFSLACPCESTLVEQKLYQIRQ